MIYMDKSTKYEEQEHQGTTAPERTGLEIAVIGMAGRFPGAPDIHRFWENLKNGIESISFFSKEELKEAGVDPQLLDNPNYVRAKGILEGSEYFDAPFFGYLPVEAEIMDPQVRVFHECAWAALEDAGYVPETYNGLIGIYAGAVDNLNWQVLNLLAGRETGAGSAGETGGLGNAKVDPYSAYLLSSRDHIASRISYKLNLKGPSMLIQAACSTSLTAIDNGCRALLTGICDMVLAGGININYPQKTGFLHQEGMIYSSDGHCRVFDAKASGTVPAEAAGIAVLKRLEEAETDGDHIYAVIKGFAVNNDGMEKVGYTAPSVTGQANVIRDALRAALVNPESIGYIETHGTGTHLGDPVEIDALKSAFHTDKKHFCAIGAVKANLGHTNCAAGIASFIKTALILKHKLIPPSLHFENPNPEIDFENSPFYVNTKLKEWKCEGYPRRAGVSSFGIGGANVHMVLEEYMQGALFDKTGEKDYELILLSARTAGALEKATENLFLDFKGNPKTSLPDAAYTLQVGRKHFSHRRTAVCSTIEEVLDALAPENRFKTRTCTITTRLEKKRPPVFLFPGQGAQYVAMGLDLYRKEPLFRRELDRCFKILNTLAGADVKEILYPSTGDYRSDRTNIIHQTEIAQPLIFAFEYALASLLMSWGIEPAAMVGHSIGEYTAACLAGVFSLEDALQLVALRGRLMQKMPTGAMLSVAMPEEQLKSLLTDDISLAAVNSPSRCVVSGPCDAIDAFEAEIKTGGIECTRLHTSHAFHSRMMDPILEPFREKVGATRMNKPAKPYISNVSGRWVAAGEAMDPAYWVRHLRETVRFSDGVKLLLGKDDFGFIEVGPGNSLTTLVKQHEGTPVPAVVNLVRRPQEEAPDDRYLLDKIGQLWLYGISIDWPGFHRGEKRYRVPLPTYPFEGRRFLTQNNFFQMGSKLLAERFEMARKPHIADWFYVPLWEQSIVSPRKAAVKNDSFQWLVFADNSSLSARLVEALESHGHEVSVVMAGAGFHIVKEKRYTIDPARKDDYNTLFSRLAQSKETPRRILHMWNIDVSGEGGLESVDRAMDLGFYSLLNIVTALDSAGAARDIRLDVATSCLQRVSENECIKPERAAIPAALRTIRREYPYISCRCIDIIPPPPGDPQEDNLVENLVLEFSTDRCSVQDTHEAFEIAAWRGANRWVLHYKPYRLDGKANPGQHIREAGVYLVTGGLGGIGTVFARRLASDFKARLILVGRSPFPPEGQWEEWLKSHEDADPVSAGIRELREMLANGAQVMTSSADVSNLEEMRGVINAAVRRFGPINGVIHAAGLADYDGLIQRRTRQATDKILAAKVKGTLVLDYLLKDVDLDFAILCSSNSSILAPPGQVGYTAANAFLDAFAHAKAAGARAPGVWISIAWSPWQVGMSMEAVKKQNRDAANLLQEGISPSEGVDILYLLLEHRLSQAAICPVDLGAVIGKMDRREAGADAPGRDTELEKTGPAILSPRPGLSVEYAAPRHLLEQALADIWQPYFGLEKIGVHDNFFELGGDSLKGMTLVNQYNKLLGETAPVAIIFNAPTIAELADYFTRHYPRAAARIRQGDAAVSDRENTYASIQPAEKKEYYELSYNQKRLWIIQQTDPANTSYNMVGFFLLRHHADGETVRKTLVRIGRKHESFRTSFKEENGEPFQFIEDNVEIPLEVMDISGLEEKEKESRRNAVLETEKRTPFDLSRAPLFRVKLVKQAEELWYFIFNIHHIIGDGWSNEILKKDFQHYYEAYRAGQEVNTEILPLQYRDFAAWQNRSIRDPGLKENACRSWLNKLEKGFTPFHLPGDFERTKSNSTAAVYRVVVGNETRDRLHGLAAGNNTTLFIVMFTVFNWLLARFSGRADILCGIISAGREHMELQDIVGFFVNSLPAKIQVNTEEEFGDFLRRVDTELRELFQYQSYPLELVLDEYKIAYPEVSLCFNMLNMPDTPAEVALENFAVGHIEDLGEAKFDLVLYAVDYKNGIILNWSYKETLFKSRTMEIIAAGYLELLNAVTSTGEEESTAKEE